MLALAAPARADSPGRAKRIAGVIAALGGAVLVVTAAALGNQASNDEQLISNLFAVGGSWNKAARDFDAEGRRDDLAQKILYPIGGVAIAAGVATAFVGLWQDKHAQKKHAVLVTPTPGGAAASWIVSF